MNEVYEAHVRRVGTVASRLSAVEIDAVICGEPISRETEEVMRQLFDLVRDYERYGTTDPAQVDRLDAARQVAMIASINDPSKYRPVKP